MKPRGKLGSPHKHGTFGATSTPPVGDVSRLLTKRKPRLSHHLQAQVKAGCALLVLETAGATL